MNNFVWIPVLSLLCYLILMLAFLAAKKTKLINSFLFLLFVFVAWTMGSFCMRQQFFPSMKFWFYVSIDGLFFLAYAFYYFITEYVGMKRSSLNVLWVAGTMGIVVVNHVTGGLFIAPPAVLESGNRIRFVYDIHWPISIPFAFVALILLDTGIKLLRYSKTDEFAKKKFMPIGIGIILLFLGNVATALPIFRGFPIDILAGLANAALMIYALYRRRLFKLTLLVSRSTCYIMSGILALALFTNMIGEMEVFIRNNFRKYEQYSVLIIAVIFTMATLVFYSMLRRFVDRVFIKEELFKADCLNRFSAAISRTLNVDEILKLLIGAVQETVSVEKIYVCVRDFNESGFRIVQSTSPLDERSLFIRKDNPLVIWMAGNRNCLRISDLKKTPAYKAMWETEKEQLEELQIECVLPLVDEEELVGLVLLSNKMRNARYSYDDMGYLESLASVSSIAVKNSRLYEKVYQEARTDELTGLLNRKYFYEVLEEEYRRIRPKELSLLLINVDDFKLFNQLYGNAEGDCALQNVACIIRGTVGNHGKAARYGGKEFAVILPGYDVLSAKSLAEVIRSQIMDMNRRDADYAMKVLTVSCGICAIPAAASDLKQLVNNADMAVYNAKRSGKNCTVLYSEGILGIAEGEKPEGMAAGYKANAYNEYAATVYALTAAIDAKDHYTFSHSENVSYYAAELARSYGLNADCVEIAREAGLLHDIGKIGIPERVLQKPGKLEPDEYEVMKSHVEQAISIIRHLPSLNYVIPAVIGHHERYDGKGYPRGLKGEDIPLLARVLCVADSFDAMVSKRSYKDAFDVEYALRELDRNSGTQFDPALAGLFVQLVKNHAVEVRN